jgi:hypothetical protein
MRKSDEIFVIQHNGYYVEYYFNQIAGIEHLPKPAGMNTS